MLAEPPTVRAASTAAQQRFVSLLTQPSGSGTIQARQIGVFGTFFPPGEVAAWVRNTQRFISNNGFRTPPIPRILLIQPRPAGLQFAIDRRRELILTVFQQRAAFRGGVAGGVFFSPGGTSITPVSPVNIFNFFPVFRVP